jgi:hypothetical protein
MRNNSSGLSLLALGMLSLVAFGCDEAELADEALAQDVLADEADRAEGQGQAGSVPHVDALGSEVHEVASGTNYYTPVGYHDTFNCNTVAGWVKDGDSTAPTHVTIHRGAPWPNGLAVTTVLANLYRGDLPFADKNHGFSFATPAAFKTGQPETIYIHGINIDAAGNWDTSANSPLLNPVGRTICCGEACSSGGDGGGPGPKDPLPP